MGYGLECTSTDDGSLILSADALNAVFNGKGSYTGVETTQLSTNVFRQILKYNLPTESTTTAPIIFLELNTIGVEVLKLYYSSPYWRLEVLTNTETSAVTPVDVYCFEPSHELGATTGYGLQLYKSDGTLSYDSGHDELLQIDEIVDTVVTVGNSYTLDNTYTKTGALFTSNAVRYAQFAYTIVNGVYYYRGYWWITGLGLSGGTLKYNDLATGTQDNVASSLSSTDKQKDMRVNEGKSCSVPIIDCSIYD